MHLDDPNVKALAEADPALALQGARPHVVDEWQEVPSTWDATRRAVDAAGGERGLFILTGSSTPAKDAVTHSGAGRIARVDMSTMTLWERGLSTGSVSLSGLFEGSFDPSACETSLAPLADAICCGGWPALVGADAQTAAEVVDQYLDAMFEISVPKKGGTPDMARRIVSSLARNVATAATLQTIAQDASLGDEAGAPAAPTPDRFATTAIRTGWRSTSSSSFATAAGQRWRSSSARQRYPTASGTSSACAKRSPPTRRPATPSPSFAPLSLRRLPSAAMTPPMTSTFPYHSFAAVSAVVDPNANRGGGVFAAMPRVAPALTLAAAVALPAGAPCSCTIAIVHRGGMRAWCVGASVRGRAALFLLALAVRWRQGALGSSRCAVARKNGAGPCPMRRASVRLLKKSAGYECEQR